ncbi:MAG: hypothetical protein ACR2KL_07780 [Nocardioidaceae bacterium]
MAEQNRHPDVLVLAEHAEGLLDEAAQEVVTAHLRGCAACANTVADLADLPAVLAGARLPAMPLDVATRIDAALTEAAASRSTEGVEPEPLPAGSSARHVVPLRRRRWLAPALAAAATVAVVGIGVPVVRSLTSAESSTSASQLGDPAGVRKPSSASKAAGTPTSQPMSGADTGSPRNGTRPVLRSASFGQDVLRSFYAQRRAADPQAFDSVRNRPAVPTAAELNTSRDQVTGGRSAPLCYGQSERSLPRIIVDGTPAYLLRYGPRPQRQAVAYTCTRTTPHVLAAAVLDLTALGTR